MKTAGVVALILELFVWAIFTSVIYWVASILEAKAGFPHFSFLECFAFGVFFWMLGNIRRDRSI